MRKIIKTAWNRRACANLFLLAALFALLCANAWATPISTTPTYSFAGNINFVGTGGSMRDQPNSGDACSVTTPSVQALSGIPATATIRAAFLYWVHSGTTTDTRVRLNGTQVNATRTFSEVFVFGGTSYNFRGGFADVTSIVDSRRNGNYRFRGLNISTGNPWCPVQAVVGGWALVVIYEDSSEKRRVINLFDGLQYFRNSSITLTPNNFVVSDAQGKDGKLGHISWEGDSTLTGVNEFLSFNGNKLTDANNPINDQYNSTISHLGNLISNTCYGVDFDVYDISSYLTAGDTSATAVYSAAGDLVLLSCEIMSVTSRAADLSISKTHTGNFITGGTGDFTITVTNNGPDAEDGVVTVTDVLPSGLTYNSFSGTGWSVDTSGAPTIVFTYDCTSSPVPSGSSLPALTLTVNVGSAAYPSVSNTATVSSTAFDNISSNDSSTDTVTVTAGADLAVTKTVDNSTPRPGDTIVYTVTVTNNGTENATNTVVNDLLPSGVTYVSYSSSQGTYNSGTGAWSVGTVNSGASATLAITATVDSGVSGTVITNTASSGGSDFPDPDSGNDSASVDITLSGPDLVVMKNVVTLSDPVSASNPKAIPGAVMLYTIQVSNQGTGAVDSDTMVVTDAVPANTKLYVGNLGNGPVVFVDGSSYGGTDSGLTYTFVSLGDNTDDLEFSNDNGATYTYVPTPDADSCDSAVTNIRVNPKGQMDGASGGNQPSFQLRFRVQVK